MPFTQFTSLDFDEIKTSIKDYIRANTTFTGYDYEGSNLSVLINILAYNTYLTAYNSNMIANEVFPRYSNIKRKYCCFGKKCWLRSKIKKRTQAIISFNITGLPETYRTVTLDSGLVCIGSGVDGNFKFSIPEQITVPVRSGTASFSNITVYEGTFLSQSWIVDTNEPDIKYDLPNSFVDTSTIRVSVRNTASDSVKADYTLVDNIVNVKNDSRIYLIQEVNDERHRILFGDGVIGRKLENNNQIDATYITSSGEEGNGVSNFIFSGYVFTNINGITSDISTGISLISTNVPSNGGAEIESISSIKYLSTRLYSSQYRAVTARDYEVYNSIYLRQY